MTEDVKQCVNMRRNFLSSYFHIPASAERGFADFLINLGALAEKCTTAAEFEERFINSGLADQFNGLLTKCTPKSPDSRNNSRQFPYSQDPELPWQAHTQMEHQEQEKNTLPQKPDETAPCSPDKSQCEGENPGSFMKIFRKKKK